MKDIGSKEINLNEYKSQVLSVAGLASGKNKKTASWEEKAAQYQKLYWVASLRWYYPDQVQRVTGLLVRFSAKNTPSDVAFIQQP